MLQETLGKGDEVISSISKLLPDLVFHALDTVGRSGGVVSGFNSKNLRYISSWGFVNCLAMELYSSELNLSFLSLNIDGPCVERE